MPKDLSFELAEGACDAEYYYEAAFRYATACMFLGLRLALGQEDEKYVKRHEVVWSTADVGGSKRWLPSTRCGLVLYETDVRFLELGTNQVVHRSPSLSGVTCATCLGEGK